MNTGKQLDYSNFDPKVGLDHMKDPVYSYIKFTKPIDGSDEESTERDIIDTKWVQRLRRIRQTQCCNLVYPGQEHSRFQHSVGVMHLAGQFAREWYGTFYWTLKSGKVEGIDEIDVDNLPSINFVEEVFRLAGLLHDIGHGPFSHSMDISYEKIFEKELTHEHVSKIIIETELPDLLKKIKRSPNGKFNDLDDEIDPKMIAWLIRSKESNEFEDKKYWWLRNMKTIISGFYDVDLLDYIVRDALHGGSSEYGHSDVERLKTTSFLTPTGICIYKNSLPALENLLISRMQMYKTCYYHKTVRAFEILVEKIMPETLKILGLKHPDDDKQNFLKIFFELDEYYIYHILKEWSKFKSGKKKNLARMWQCIYDRKPVYKLAFVSEQRIDDEQLAKLMESYGDAFNKELKKVFDNFKNMTNEELISEGLQEDIIKQINELEFDDIEKEIALDSPYLSPRRINPLSSEYQFAVYDPRVDKIPNDWDVMNLLQKVPLKFQLFRVFSKIGTLKLVSIIAHEANKAFGGIPTKKTNF